jgi:hypothetical protein
MNHPGGLSLWLSPPASSPLSAYLDQLSTRLSTVSFSAHATLVSDEIVPALDISDLVLRIEAAVRTWRSAGGNEGLDLLFNDVRQGPYLLPSSI